MKIRIAEIDDLETLNTISLESKAYWGYPISWIENWLDELTLNKDKLLKQNVLVVENENEIIDFSSTMENIENYEYFIYGFCQNILEKDLGRSFSKRLSGYLLRLTRQS